MKKLCVFLFILFLLSGCSKHDKVKDTVFYNLDISDGFKEEVIIPLSRNAYDIADKYSLKKGEYLSLEYLLT